MTIQNGIDTYSRILVFSSANLDVSNALARLQYGHHDFEKIVMVFSEIAVCSGTLRTVVTTGQHGVPRRYLLQP